MRDHPQPSTAGLGRRDRKRVETRARLYRAALELFLENGYEATTMDDIAARARTARATAYNHFPRKNVFLAEWMRNRRAEVSDDVEQDGQQHPVDQLLRRYLTDLAEINLAERELTRRLLPAWTREGGPLEDEPELATALTRYIRRGIEQGEIRPDCDARLAGHVLRSAYLGTLYLWLRTPDGEDFDLVSQLNEGLDLVLRGLLITSQAADPPAVAE